MSEHFIKEIEIKDYKLFKDFKAEGFGRVNLIGGKNNVGKTAFMEACYLGINTKDKKSFFQALLIIELVRDPLKEFYILYDVNSFNFKFNEAKIFINKTQLQLDGAFGIPYDEQLYELPKKDYDKGIKEILQFYKGDCKPLELKNNSFIPQNSIRSNFLKDCIDEIKLLKKWKDLNNYLLETFRVEQIDVIKDEIVLFQDNNYYSLYEYGDGIKHFISIILSLFLNQNRIVFIDEIENGIHYTNFDKLWEIILTLSKEQNVQVFATTHSKECIESYARVSKRLLEDKKVDKEDIVFIEMGRDKENKVSSMIYPYNWFIDEIEQNHEVRGW